MGSRMNHSKVKRQARAKFGERADRNTRGSGPSRSWRNLRTEWDGPAFPVIVRQIEPEDRASDPR